MADVRIVVTDDSDAMAIGEIAARAHFRKVGEPQTLQMTEAQLAMVCALTAQMMFDSIREIKRRG